MKHETLELLNILDIKGNYVTIDASKDIESGCTIDNRYKKVTLS